MMYLTRPVFEFPIHWNESPSKPLTFDLNKLEIGFGKPFFAALQSHVVQGYDFSLYLKSAAEIMAFDDFTAALTGRLAGFWLPAPFLTLEIIGAVSATQFDIADQGLRNTLATHPDVYLWLRRPGLAARPCKIGSVALQGAGVERVTLTAALATPATPADSAVRLHYVRLASDVERGSFIGENKIKRQVSVVELPHEYEAFETGERAIYLYHFWAEVPMDKHWYFTSFAADVISNNQRYTKFPMNHGALKKSARIDNETLDIEARFDVTHPLSLYLPVPFSRPLNVEVSKCSYADPDTIELLFTGTVRRVPDLGDRVKAEVNSWTSVLARKVPPMLIQAEDNFDIFDEVTGSVPRWRFEITGTVVDVDAEALPPTLTLDFNFPESADYAKWITADWFANGKVECGQGVQFAARSILTSAPIGAGDPKQLFLELNEPVNPVVGSLVTLTPGYDGSYVQRRDKFGDAGSFGGFVAMPESNPTLRAIDVNQSQGGKK
jgi:hypothetical protein